MAISPEAAVPEPTETPDITAVHTAPSVPPTAWKKVVALWAAWAAILLGFQIAVPERLPVTPLANDQPALLDTFMNEHAAWDSEFYLSIAVAGYDAPNVRTVSGPDGRTYTLNYAFFPVYPYLMRAVMLPLGVLGLSPLGTATLAGVIVSIVGALAGMLALYDLTRGDLGEQGGARTAYYLAIFPTGFFLAQVYSEGLFVGLTFGCLALIRRRRWLGAAALAMLAAGTRAVGVALIIPLALAWLREADWQAAQQRPVPLRMVVRGLLVLSPLVVYAIWRSLMGDAFDIVQTGFFERGMFQFAATWQFILKHAPYLWTDLGGALYHGAEFASVLLAVIASLLTLRKYPGPALVGLASIFVAATSGPLTSMSRYALSVPSIFILLGGLGRREVFDRSWSLASTLWMAMLAILFTFNHWGG